MPEIPKLNLSDIDPNLGKSKAFADIQQQLERLQAEMTDVKCRLDELEHPHRKTRLGTDTY